MEFNGFFRITMNSEELLRFRKNYCEFLKGFQRITHSFKKILLILNNYQEFLRIPIDYNEFKKKRYELLRIIMDS